MWILACLILIVAAALFLRHTQKKRSRRFLALMSELGLRSIGTRLPNAFPPQTNAWLPSINIGSCFTGRFNGFEVAIFSANIGSGEGTLSRSMVAVKRVPFTPQVTPFLARLVQFDTTSTPGWLIASINGTMMRAEIAKALLHATTASSSFAQAAAIDEEDQTAHPSSLYRVSPSR